MCTVSEPPPRIMIGPAGARSLPQAQRRSRPRLPLVEEQQQLKGNCEHHRIRIFGARNRTAPLRLLDSDFDFHARCHRSLAPTPRCRCAQ